MSVMMVQGPECFTPVTNTLRLLHRYGGNAMQICLGDMTDLKSIMILGSTDCEQTLRIKTKYNKYIVVHGKYIYNFCHPNKDFYRQALLKELTEANKIGADVIIHQGKNVNGYPADQARKVYVSNIKAVIKSMRETGLTNRVILENSAHQGTEIGYSLNELHLIWMMFEPEEQKHLGICIDTCHMFVAGELDVSNPLLVEEWFNKFDRLIGRANLRVVHFNDSTPEFGACNDHHAGLGRGHIGLTGLKTVASICASWGVPIITETPPHEMAYEIALMKEWVSQA